MKTFTKLLTAASLLVGLAPAAVAELPKELNFGIISTESTQNLKVDWEPMLKDLEKSSGIKVNAFFAPDYAGIIEAMRFNKVQVAWFGNKSGMEAADRASAEVFVQTMAADGSPGYWSFLIVHKDSPLKSIEDVKKSAKDLTLGFGDPNSTSGFLVPGYYAFALNGLDPKTSFKRIVTANHETNLLATANKQVDFATNNNESYERFKMKFPEKADAIRVIWKSPLIAADPFMWRTDLDAEAKKRVKSFFLGYGKKDEREKAVLKKIGLSGFRDSSNNQLLPTRQLELFKTKNKVESDTALSADEKKLKLDEINQKLADLNKQMAALK
jgi:phosphonate transport system substrate-binding protein